MNVCAQIWGAVGYMLVVHVIHNDIKGDNILIGLSRKLDTSTHFQIILVDFGKNSQGNKYNLSLTERAEYRCKYLGAIKDRVRKYSP